MNFRALLMTVSALSIMACAEQEQEAPAPMSDAAESAPAPEAAAPEAEVPEAAAPEAEAPEVAAPEAEIDEAFLAHMHEHAEKLDDINFALADDDLEEAKLPAYWLSRHESVSGIPADWKPFVDGMRGAAVEVENAADLDAARAAAARITEHCQGCHVASGTAIP